MTSNLLPVEAAWHGLHLDRAVRCSADERAAMSLGKANIPLQRKKAVPAQIPRAGTARERKKTSDGCSHA
jgi:hypothetical protein